MTSRTNGAGGSPSGDPSLLPQHAELLRASAISDELIAQRGYRSILKAGDLNGLFGSSQRRPGLLIPLYDVYGERFSHQLRPDDPRTGDDGKLRRYETPTGLKMALDVPPSMRQQLGDPAVPLWICEGIKKVDALASVGLAGVALLGVWNWRGKNDKGGATVLPDWEAIALKGRTVIIAFDSDALWNPGVHNAAERLGRWLEHRGAKPAFAYLPSENGAKVGVDDYLAHHGKDELLALVCHEWRPLASEPQAAERIPDGPLLSTDELLAQVSQVLDRYVRLPSRKAVLAISFWVLHTWAFDGAHATPYLVIRSPTKRSGKTRLEETLELVVRAPWRIAAASESVMFRKIADQRPTLLLDECDAIFGRPDIDPLRGILDAGNRPGASVARNVGEGSNQTPVDFSVYCPKVLAGIGGSNWPDTVLDRSIRITLQRKKREEAVERFRYRKAYAETEELRNALAVWASMNVEALAEAEPDLPHQLDDRAAEGWEPLLAIADTASTEMAALARRAAVGLAKDAPDDEDGQGVLLLHALKALFADREVVWTEHIIEALNEDEELPFGGYRKGAGIDSRSLAKLLKPFDIRPRDVRIGEAKAKGYKHEWFADAWERYCTVNPPGSGNLSATSETSAPQSQKSAIFYPRQKSNVADKESAENPHSNADVADVSDKSAQPRGQRCDDSEIRESDGPLVREALRKYGSAA
jgi:hypothetical protein